MKKALFLSAMSVVGHLYGLTEDNVRRFDLVKPLLGAHQALHSKMDLFCQSALHAFGAEAIITVQQVLHRLEGDSAQSDVPQLNFATVDDFVSWVSSQKKTALVLTDQGNIKSAICVEYMQYLSQQPGFNAEWYTIDYDHLTPILWALHEAGADVMQPTDVVPNVVFVIDGKLWQIPEECAADGLKCWIDLELKP